MVKLAETVKERDLEPQILAVLRGLLTRVPFLKLNSLRVDVPIRHPREPLSRPDFIAKVHAGTHEWTLVVEVKNSGQPQMLRTALLQFQHYLSLLPPDVPRYGVLLAPFISPESTRLCAEAGMGYADLAGNCRLTFDNMYIETHGADNPFREKRALKSLFTPKAARILRVLLQGPLRPWKVKDLAAHAGVSLGHVSDVRQQLIAQEWAVEDPADLRVTRPSIILDAWAAADRWEDRTTVREYSLLLTDPADIAVRVDSLLSNQQHAFTQWIAATQSHPYTTPPVTTVYVTDFPDDARLKDELLAWRVDSGGRLRLVQPACSMSCKSSTASRWSAMCKSTSTCYVLVCVAMKPPPSSAAGPTFPEAGPPREQARHPHRLPSPWPRCSRGRTPHPLAHAQPLSPGSGIGGRPRRALPHSSQRCQPLARRRHHGCGLRHRAQHGQRPVRQHLHRARRPRLSP